MTALVLDFNKYVLSFDKSNKMKFHLFDLYDPLNLAHFDLESPSTSRNIFKHSFANLAGGGTLEILSKYELALISSN